VQFTSHIQILYTVIPLGQPTAQGTIGSCTISTECHIPKHHRPTTVSTTCSPLLRVWQPVTTSRSCFFHRTWPLQLHPTNMMCNNELLSKAIRWVGHLDGTWDDESIEHFNLTNHLLKFRHRWRDNIKMISNSVTTDWMYQEDGLMEQTWQWNWDKKWRTMLWQWTCNNPTGERRVETVAPIKHAYQQFRSAISTIKCQPT
jgi:hypothetical protein